MNVETVNAVIEFIAKGGAEESHRTAGHHCELCEILNILKHSNLRSVVCVNMVQEARMDVTAHLLLGTPVSKSNPLWDALALGFLIGWMSYKQELTNAQKIQVQ